MRSGGSATRRNTLIVVAVVVMAGLLVAAFLLGRRSPSANPATATPAAGSSSTGAASTPAASSPAGTSGASDTLPRGKAVSTGGGSKTGPAGVQLGYPHTQEGAVSAVTNYAVTRSLPAIADPKVAKAIAESIAAPGSTDAVVGGLGDWADFTRDQYVLSEHPSWGAYAVLNYNDNEALVGVWWPLTYAKGANYSARPEGEVDHLLGPLWTVRSFRVVWAQGDWKWVDFEEVSRAGQNLNPQNPDAPPSAQEKWEILHRPNPLPAENEVGYQTWDWVEYADA